MKKSVILFCLLFSLHSFSANNPGSEINRIHLPNGWSLTPAGQSLPLGDLPLNIAVSSSQKLIAVTNNGQSDQTIQLIDAVNFKTLDTIVVGKSWFGIAFSNNEKSLYVSGGNDNWILCFDISKKKLVPRDTIVLGKPWPELISPAGLCVDDEKKILYVVTKEDNSLYVVDLATKKIKKQIALGAEG